MKWVKSQQASHADLGEGRTGICGIQRVGPSLITASVPKLNMDPSLLQKEDMKTIPNIKMTSSCIMQWKHNFLTIIYFSK